MTPNDLLKRGLRLEYLTLAWNVVGAAIVLVSALVAGSVALAGFGIDSLIEIFASVVVVWQLNGTAQHRERRALRLIGAAFFALVAYVLLQSARTVLLQAHPETSPLGIIWLAATLAAMLLLARGKHQTGLALNNPVLLTEARVTLQIETAEHNQVQIFKATEIGAGVYSAKPSFPESGEWLVLVEVRRDDQISARVITFEVADPRN